MNPEPRYAYDVYAQTKFDQEETIMKGLQAQEMSEEERNKMYWHIINNKRMFETLLQIVPYYLAWVLSILLLVSVSNFTISRFNPILPRFDINLFLVLVKLQRPWGRPLMVFTTFAFGAFEFVAKIYYGQSYMDFIVSTLLTVFPSNYTIGESLKVIKKGLPLFLTLILYALDNSIDAYVNKDDDSLEKLRNIVDRQSVMIKAAQKLADSAESLRKAEPGYTPLPLEEEEPSAQKPKKSEDKKDQPESKEEEKIVLLGREEPTKEEQEKEAKEELAKDNSRPTGRRLTSLDTDIDQLYGELLDFNKNEMSFAMGDQLDSQEAKKEKISLCSRIFKALLAFGFLFSMITYAFSGKSSGGFKKAMF